MYAIKIRVVLLLLVVAFSTLPRYGAGSSECGSNQKCVLDFLCENGYIATESLLIDSRIVGSSRIEGIQKKCVQSDYPNFPAVCCNKPGVREPPSIEDCNSNQKCVLDFLCENGYIATESLLIDSRGKRSAVVIEKKCVQSDYPNFPAVCCNTPVVPESPSIEEPENTLCRSDLRCGPRFPLPGGQPSQCDPSDKYHCCSPWGWCGETSSHCNCFGCTDYNRK